MWPTDQSAAVRVVVIGALLCSETNECLNVKHAALWGATSAHTLQPEFTRLPCHMLVPAVVTLTSNAVSTAFNLTVSVFEVALVGQRRCVLTAPAVGCRCSHPAALPRAGNA